MTPEDFRADGRPVVAVFRAPLFNASETFVQRQAAGLPRYQPLVVGLEDKGNAIPALRERMLVASGAADALAFRLGRVGRLAAQVRPFAPRLVHAHFGTDGLMALPLAQALGVPLVTSLRGYDVTRSRAALLRSGSLSWMRYALGQRRLMGEGTLFLAVSDALRDRAIAMGYPEGRTVTHYNGIDLARFCPGKSSPEFGLVLHVGRLVEKKGTSDLIEAFADIHRAHSQAKLVIIGDGPLRPALERAAAPLGGAVRFTGALPPEQVIEWMQRAWLLAAPSVTAGDGDAEGLPNTVVEAAASGLPVLGTRHSGIPEAVIHGETGLLVREHDAAGLAEALGVLLGSAELRARMAAGARKLAEARFDAARQAALLEQHYDAVSG